MATTAKHMSPLLESTLDGLAPLSEATTLNASHMSGLDKEKERSSPAGAAAASTTTTTDGAGAEIPCYFRIDPVPENPGDLKVLDPAKLPDGSPAPAPLLAAGMFRPSSIEDLRGSTLLFGLAFLVWLGSAVFGAGLAGALVVAWAFVHYHDMSNEKLVNKLRLEAEYNASRRRAQLGTEDADWFNMILGKFWLAYEPTLSSTIQASLDPILEWVCPSFIDSMTFSTFTLGTFPPQLRNIIHARHQPDDIVDFQFDLALGAFGPRTAASNAAAAATAGAGVSASDVALDEQPTGGDSAVAVGSNVRVDLVVRIKGIGATVRAENVTLEGRMRIRMKLMTAFPHVKVLELWFLEAPKVDFQLRPLGGFDMNGFSGFRKWLSETISWGISTNLVWPVPLVIPLDDWFNHPSAEANASIGVLVVHIKSAQGLKNADLIGKSDPFVKISLAGQTVAKTVVIHNNLNPFWDVIKYIPISKLKEADLKLGVYDYDKGLRSKLLGYAPVNISSLDAAKGGALPQAEFDLADSENRPAGKMYASVSFYPVADPLAVPQSLPAAADAAAPVAAAAAAATTATLNPQNGPTAGAAAAAAAQATVAAPPVPAECPSGLLKVYCHAARGIETGSKLRSSFVEVAFNGENAYTTRIKKHSNTPLWEESFEVFVPDFKTAKLNFKLKEDVNKTVAGIAGIGGGDRSADGLLGQTTLAVADVLKTNLKEDWWALSDAVTREAKIRVTMKWRPVPLRADSTNISVGVLRVRVLQCYDLKATMAKINPYVRLVRGGKTRAQSRRLVDTANPSFDESLFSLIRDKDEQIQLQVWDYTRGLKDTMVGAATLDLSNYILEDPETGAMSSRGIEKDELRLTLQDPTKSRGRMAVEISFHPKNPAMPFSPESPDVCGVVKVNVHQLKDLPRKTSSYFEIYADDPNLPLYRSNTRKKTSDPIFEQTTEIFIRQVLWSPIHIVFREDSGANAAEAAITAGGGADSAAAMPSKRSDSKSNPVIGAVELFCYNVVSEALGEEKWYPMTSSGASTKAKLSFDFVPVECAIDSSESLGNMGLLTVEVVGARDLPKTDQVGSCDPFVVVLLNDARWFRTEVFKKNRNPVWKERVKIPVLDRRHSWLKLDVYDWDRVGDNDRIGGVELNLANIPVDEQMTIELPVDERGDRGFVTFSYRFEAQRMDKVPSRAMTLARGALDRLDPRKVLGAGRFSTSFKTTMDVLTAGASHGNGLNVSTSETLARQPTELGNVVGEFVKRSESADMELPQSTSVDFGSNSSLCSYVDQHLDKVSSRGAVTVTVIQADNLIAVDADGSSDPYVKIKITPPGSTMTHRPIKIETTTRQNDLNPIWEETFTHALPKSATPHEPLSFRCAVWDSNKVQSDLMIGQFEFNLFDLVFERFHKNRAVKDSRSGWVYVSQDVTLTLTLEQAAIVANEKARRTRQATTGSAANSTGVLAQNDMPFGGGQPKPLAQPTLRVHVAVLLPPGYIDESQLPVHRPFPPGMESMLDDDDPWREEVIFPNALVHAANAAGKAPMAGSPVTPLTAEHRPTSMSHTGLDMLSPDNAAGRSRANSLAMETASIASSMKKKPFSGLRKVFKRNKEKGAAPEMDESLEEMRTSMSE